MTSSPDCRLTVYEGGLDSPAHRRMFGTQGDRYPESLVAFCCLKGSKILLESGLWGFKGR